MPNRIGNGKFLDSALKRSLITGSKINTSTIDMSGYPITSVKNPILNQDAATKIYVDERVEQITESVLSNLTGIIVTLTGIDITEIAYIKAGSYVVTVSSANNQEGFPTASYSISRSSDYSAGSIARLTAGPGKNTYEQLELIWPAGSNLSLRKNGFGYDGDYSVDLSIKNLSAVSAPPINEKPQLDKY